MAKSEVGRCAVIKIELKPGMNLELNGKVDTHTGNMVGIKAFATDRVYHLFQYQHMQGSNIYQGTLIVGKKRMPMKARLL